eukprot:3696862-Rhodomonas_salina.1
MQSLLIHMVVKQKYHGASVLGHHPCMLHQYQTSSTASRPCVHAVRIHCLPPAVQRKPQGHEKAREQREDDEDAAQEGVSEEELAQHRHLPEPVVIPAVRHEVVARFRSERLREVAARRDLLKEI